MLKLLFHRLRLLLPERLRRILKNIGLKSLVRRFDPFEDEGYKYPLTGPLAGCVLKVSSLSERQFVTAVPCYEPDVCEAIVRLVHPGMICADVGANIGYITLLMAKCCGPAGKVYVFEALPRNARLAQENVAVNSLTERVVVENVAVCDKSGDHVFLYEGDTTSEFSLLPRAGHSGRLAVPTIALDDYFVDRPPPDFVKMDIEGAEAQAVVGMQKLLREHLPIMLLELHGEPGASALRFLIEAGYSVTDLSGSLVDDWLDSSAPSHILAYPPR